MSFLKIAQPKEQPEAAHRIPLTIARPEVRVAEVLTYHLPTGNLDFVAKARPDHILKVVKATASA